MLPVNREVGIQRQDTMIVLDFRHADDTGVGQRHWGISVFSQQTVHRADMLLQPERQGQRAILQQIEQRVLRPWKSREQVIRFRQHGLANKQRRVELLYLTGGPPMIAF